MIKLICFSFSVLTSLKTCARVRRICSSNPCFRRVCGWDITFSRGYDNIQNRSSSHNSSNRVPFSCVKTSGRDAAKLPVFQVTYRKLTFGPSRCCRSWRSPWSSYKMWRMARCTRAWPMARTPRVPYSSTCSWSSGTLPSVTSSIPGSLNTLPSYTGPSCQVRVPSPLGSDRVCTGRFIESMTFDLSSTPHPLAPICLNSCAGHLPKWINDLMPNLSFLFGRSHQAFSEPWPSLIQITTGSMDQRASWSSWTATCCEMAAETGWRS